MIECEGKGVDFRVDFLEGEEFVAEVDRRMDGHGSWTLRKASKALHFVLVVGGDLLAGAGDAKTVEEFKKVAADGLEEILCRALIGVFLGPGGEVALSDAGGVLDGSDAEGFLKGLVGRLAAGHVAADDE